MRTFEKKKKVLTLPVIKRKKEKKRRKSLGNDKRNARKPVGTLLRMQQSNLPDRQKKNKLVTKIKMK